MSIFFALARSTPDGAIDALHLFAVTLPLQIASASILVLGWFGPFPESWPVIGGSLPPAASRYQELARDIAAQILDARIRPSVGCEKIARICEAAGWPDDLTEFWSLNDCQNWDDPPAVSRAEIENDIRAAAANLLEVGATRGAT